VIGEKAIVRYHAKLSGKGGAIGDVEVSGYARLYWPVVNRPKRGADTDDTKRMTVTGIPDRGRASGLVANYDCLRPEAVLLEDLLNRRITRGFGYGYHTDYGQMNFDGHLVGSPGFDAADGNGAFVFDGKHQYAELAPDVTDLGEIVVAMRVKLGAVGEEQVLFDFGGNSDNRFMLTVDPKGKPTLSWTVGGKTKSVRSSSALQAGKWADLQVSFDGGEAVVRVDGKAVARKKTSFRPADAFPPTVGRRNLVMRSREDAGSQGSGVRGQEPGARYCAGALDYLRVYSHVPAKGESLPPVPLVSPTRISPTIAEKIENAFGDHPHMVAAYRQLTSHCREVNRAHAWNDQLMLRKFTYEQEGNPKTVAKTRAMRDAYYEMEAKLAIKRLNLEKEYYKSSGYSQKKAELDAVSQELDAARRKTNQVRDALRKKLDEAKAKKAQEEEQVDSAEMEAYREKLAAHEANMAEARKQREDCDKKLRKIRDSVGGEVAPAQASMKEQIAELQKRIKSREEDLRETSSAAAKVFAPVIAEARVRHDRLSKIAKRTPEQENELRQAKADLDKLIKSRNEVLTLDARRSSPSEGIFGRDLDLLRMRTKLKRLERDSRAMINDRLIANKTYMAAAVARNRAEEQLRRRPPAAPGRKTTQQPDGFEQAFRELPEYEHQQQLEQRRNRINHSLKQGFDPYVNEKLGAFILKVEKAKNKVQTQYHENAKLHHPEEFRIVGKIDYKRIHFGKHAENMAEQLASDIEPPDSLDQMTAAAKIQQLWYTSTDDWDTRQKYEEEYEELNPVMKRWLQRVKPYRFGE
jgi:hypothetical protein